MINNDNICQDTKAKIAAKEKCYYSLNITTSSNISLQKSKIQIYTIILQPIVTSGKRPGSLTKWA